VTTILSKGSGQPIFVSHVTSNVFKLTVTDRCQFFFLAFGYVVYFIVVCVALKEIKLLSVPRQRTNRDGLGMVNTNNSLKAT